MTDKLTSLLAEQEEVIHRLTEENRQLCELVALLTAGTLDGVENVRQASNN